MRAVFCRVYSDRAQKDICALLAAVMAEWIRSMSELAEVVAFSARGTRESRKG
jgi:hypothetical protein